MFVSKPTVGSNNNKLSPLAIAKSGRYSLLVMIDGFE